MQGKFNTEEVWGTQGKFGGCSRGFHRRKGGFCGCRRGLGVSWEIRG